MAIQNEEKLITVTVYDGEIILKSPCFVDYLDMYINQGSEDDEDETVEVPTTLSRDRFLDLAATLIVRWSYPEPVTKRNIAALDAQASVALLAAINELLGADKLSKAAQAKKA